MTAAGPPQAEIAALTEALTGRDWRSGFEHFAAALEERRARELDSELWPRHTAWKGFLDPEHRRDALVIEAGYGTGAISLAQDFRRVCAAVSDPGLRQAIEARAGWLGVGNIEFLDQDRLQSIGKGSLDAVVISGLPARMLESGLIETCAELLDARGVLYLAFGNSRIGTLSRIKRALGGRFPRLEAYRYPASLTNSYGLARLNGHHGPLRQRLASWAAPLVAPAFGVAAYKSRTSRSLVERVIEEVGRQTAGLPEIRRYLFSNPSGFTLIVEDRRTAARLVIKIPFDEPTLCRQRCNFSSLQRLAHLQLVVPKPVLAGEAAGRPFFAETMLEGTPAGERTLHSAAYEALLLDSIGWIERLHAATARPCVLREQLVTERILGPLERAFAVISHDPLGEQYARIRSFLAGSFSGRTLPLVFAHGDYSADNVLVRNGSGRIAGVFDWDLAEERGLPLLDVFYFILAADSVRHGRPDSRVYSETIFPLRFSAPVGAAIERYRSTVGIPAELMFPLALLTWAYQLAYRVRRGESYRYPFLTEQLAGQGLATALELIRRSEVRPC
jgi:aminoglycoside phosphotransferase (APT) family kinase protein